MIPVPPLRRRRTDIPMLIEHFLGAHARRGKTLRFSPDAMDRLLDYAWPGNIRELRNLVERLKPHAQDLGCESELEGVLEIVEGGTGSQRQREIYKESGDFLDVVAFLIEGTRAALAEEQS